MGNFIFLLKLLNKNKLKNLIIAVQIAISVFASTFFIIPIVKSIEINKLIKNMNLDKNIGFFEESIHIQLSPQNYIGDEYTTYKEYIENLDGVKKVDSTYSILPIDQSYDAIMYDIDLCNIIKLPLEAGTWFSEDLLYDQYVPVIITNKMKKEYPLNSTFDVSIVGKNTTQNIKCKVIGILKNKSYIYIGGSNHSTPSLSDLFRKTSSNDEILIIPNIFLDPPMSWANNGLLIKYNDYTDFELISQNLKECGLGELHNFSELKANETNNVLIYNEQKIYESIIVFIFILISISGYNTLANLEYRRLLTIYYISGMTWKKGITLLTIRNLILIMVPAIISSIISNYIVCTKKTIYTFDSKNVLVTVILYLLIFAITTLITILNLKKQKPIEVLKEVD